MKTCPRCAEQVQDQAQVCKHCGHKFGFLANIGWGGTAVLVVLAIIALGSILPDDKPSGPTFDQQMAEAGKTVRIERLVKARLRDPDSATFQHLNGGCGYVNSKNGLGGMSGNTEFVVGSNDKVVFRTDGPKDFDTIWKGHCMSLLAN